MCHLSHSYHAGACLYFTFAINPPAGGDALEMYGVVKRAIQQAFVDSGATLSHHHAVGTEHAQWLEEDISSPGVAMLQALFEGFDPGGNLNPGKIVSRRATRAGPRRRLRSTSARRCTGLGMGWSGSSNGKDWHRRRRLLWTNAPNRRASSTLRHGFPPQVEASSRGRTRGCPAVTRSDIGAAGPHSTRRRRGLSMSPGRVGSRCDAAPQLTPTIDERFSDPAAHATPWPEQRGPSPRRSSTGSPRCAATGGHTSRRSSRSPMARSCTSPRASPSRRRATWRATARRADHRQQHLGSRPRCRRRGHGGARDRSGRATAHSRCLPGQVRQRLGVRGRRRRLHARRRKRRSRLPRRGRQGAGVRQGAARPDDVRPGR